jgi:hypothetical protein
VAIIGYELQVDEGFGSGFSSLTETGYTALVFKHTYLILGHTYTYRVRAANLMGFGPYSASFSFVPRSIPQQPSQAPVNIVASTTRFVLFVSYNAVINNGGSPILYYNIYIDDGMRGSFTGPINNGLSLVWSSTSMTLVTGRSYRVKYSATNVAGESLISPLTTILLAEKPSQVLNF